MIVWQNKMKQFIYRLRGQHIEFDLTWYRTIVEKINKRETDFKTKKDHELKKLALDLKENVCASHDLDAFLVEAFALVKEVSRRIVGLRHYDVQVLAGIAIHQGKLAEMKTGEGKTLAAVLPAYLNALVGKGVHILTFNDYLARRDATWMGPIYQFLGLSVGYIQEEMGIRERQAAYACDIAYATAKELGFDYLRDNLCYEKDRLVQRPYHYAIIDEADAILIDEARIPLVIAARTAESKKAKLYHYAQLIEQLEAGIDYDVDEYSDNVLLTESGFNKAEAHLGCGSLQEHKNLDLLVAVNLALHAKSLVQRDKDYIIREGKVVHVDEFTGRVVLNRKWPFGLQSAIEAKEKLEIKPEGMIRNSITLVHLMQLYAKMGAMTATARTSADDFYEFYQLKVAIVPSHRPCIRTDYPDLTFTDKESKEKALIKEIQRVHATGRPVLVGTGSVAESECISDKLQKEGITCDVLNAKNDEQEAEIVKQAGKLYRVTISTNMAGRGTDIRLGGEHEEDYDEVAALGGLYVIGTNCHESKRIDDQLRGRAGRQGDPGSSQFIVSMEDELIQRYGVDEFIPEKYKNKEDHGIINDPGVRKEVARAQRIIESQNHDIRRILMKYSSVVEPQRKTLSHRRQDILLGKGSLLMKDPELDRYGLLVSRLGKDRVAELEKQIALYHIDECWADYLDWLEHLRQGIILNGLAGLNPLCEFGRAVAQSFKELQVRIHRKTRETLGTLEVSNQGCVMNNDDFKPPSATWTYLINDNPMGGCTQRLAKGVVDFVRSKLRRSRAI